MRNKSFITLFILLLALITGCSAGKPAEAPETSQVPAPSAEPVQKEEIATNSEWPRVYVDALEREITIEKQPERIVVLHFGYTEYLLALEIPPIGVAQLANVQTFKTLENYEEMKSFIDVGEVRNPNLEKILELEPDIIIATLGVHDSALESLEKIAPVVFKASYGTWEETINDYAQMLGKEDVAETYIQYTYDIIAETYEALRPYTDKTFAFLRPSAKNTFWTPGANNTGDFYHQPENGFGLTPPSGYPTEWADISLETLAEMDPDYIFFVDNEELCKNLVAEQEATGVWGTISAVKSGNVGFLDISLNTGSPLAVRLASEQILDFVQNSKSVGNEGNWPKTHVDALGREVVIESKPENTALIFFRNFEHLIMLDEIPFAATDVEDVYKGWAVFEPYAAENEIIDLGAMQTPNIEKLLDSDPDLILVQSGVFGKVGEQLEKIAPTIAVNNYGDDWQTPIYEYGELFSKEDIAESEVQRLIAFLEDSAAKFEKYSDKTFAFLSPRNEKEFTVYVLNYVYDKESGLGLSAPEGYLEKGRETISLEGILELDPDYLFLYDNMLDTATKDILDAVSATAAWGTLNAAQNDNVYLIDRSAFSGGPMSIEYGVNAILELIGE